MILQKVEIDIKVILENNLRFKNNFNKISVIMKCLLNLKKVTPINKTCKMQTINKIIRTMVFKMILIQLRIQLQALRK